MSFRTNIKYAVYNLRESFACEPSDLRYCPGCTSFLSIFNIPPSDAVTNVISHHSGIQYDFSHLYECGVCNWWALRESWQDLGEGNGCYDFLIVGEKTDNNDTIWRQILKNGEIYYEAKTLPDTLRQLFPHKNTDGYFVPGDRVCLRTHVVVRQPLGILPPLCVQGSEGVIVQAAEYSAQYAKQLKDWYLSENVLLEDIIKRAMLGEAQAALASGRCYAVRLQHIVPLETAHKFGSCKVDEVCLFEGPDLEMLPKD